MYGYIYLTTNLINNIKYIGKHQASSWDIKYKGSGTILKRAFKKYGKENFKCEMICECISLEDLNEKEKYYINLYDAYHSKEFYNIALGGSGGNTTAGYTDEQRKAKGSKISKALSGKPKSDLHKKHLSEAIMNNGGHAGNKNPMYGVHHSGEGTTSYGFHWYNNGDEEIYVKENDYILNYKDHSFTRGMLSSHYKSKKNK